MGKIILTIGDPGTGKSRGILNLDPETTAILQPNSKDLPFKGGRKKYNVESKNVFKVNSFNNVGMLLKKINEGTKFKTVIVEDITHLFSKRVMKDAAIKGYDKWNEMAVDAFNGLLEYEDRLREDLYVILHGHVEEMRDADGEPITKLLTPGKLLDKNIKIQSYVTYVLHSHVINEDGVIKYRFLTNLDGSGKEAKSPEGCLNLLEENDYKIIIDKIEAYQN